jgi:hypothetical protein
MDETMGPNGYNAPARVLDKLTPTDSQFANEWREVCRERIAIGNPKPGDLVRFEREWSFANGDHLSELVLVKRNTFRAPLPGYGTTYRLPADWKDSVAGIVAA